MERSDIPVFYREGKWSKATSRFFIGIGNDNQSVTTKITSINFARLLIIFVFLKTRHFFAIFVGKERVKTS